MDKNQFNSPLTKYAKFGDVETPNSDGIVRQVVKGEYLYGALGLILGLAAIIGGCVLGLHGAVGHTSWTASVLGLSSKVNDAAPGVILFIVGIFLVWITKPRVDINKIKPNP